MKKILSLLRGELSRIFIGLALFVPGFVLHLLEADIPSFVLLISALIITGYDVYISAVKGILRRDFLDEKFLMAVAATGAVIIGEVTEGAAVMLFFLVGQFFEHKAVKKNRAAIRSLLDICPDTARVVRDGVEREEDAEDVEVGCELSIRPGERVPIDSVLLSASARVDTSSLTGEPLPRELNEGEEIYSGYIALDSAIRARTVRAHSESRATRVLELVENARERKSKTEAFITRFSVVYTPIVIALAILIATIPAIFGFTSWQNSVYRGLSFLVISCPCALVISVPMAFFGGIGAAATRGILYKGGNTFSDIAGIERIVFDKTGTLTKGEFRIVKKDVRIPEEEFLRLAASAEYNSNHPIARAMKAYVADPAPADEIRELTGKGIEAKIGKDTVTVGNYKLLSDLGIDYPDPSYSLYAARNGEFIGAVLLGDTVKDEARDAIRALRKLGVKHTYILSGDRTEAVKAVAEELGIDECSGELMPEEKYQLLEQIISESRGGVVYVGDGINDAPCLTRADVGIAMGEGGSDSAIESADAVIMSSSLEKIPETVKIARKTLNISRQNIAFALSVKVLVMLLSALNLSTMWMAVIADVGVAIIAILNSMRALNAR